MGVDKQASHKQTPLQPEEHFKEETNGYVTQPEKQEGAYEQIPLDKLIPKLANPTEPINKLGSNWQQFKQDALSGIVYHGTTKEIAEQILKQGFRGLEFDAILAEVQAKYPEVTVDKKRHRLLEQIKTSYREEHHLVSTSPAGEVAIRWAGQGGEVARAIERVFTGEYVVRAKKPSRISGEPAVVQARIKNMAPFLPRLTQVFEGLEQIIGQELFSGKVLTEEEAFEDSWSSYNNLKVEPNELEVLRVIEGADLQKLKQGPLKLDSKIAALPRRRGYRFEDCEDMWLWCQWQGRTYYNCTYKDDKPFGGFRHFSNHVIWFKDGLHIPYSGAEFDKILRGRIYVWKTNPETLMFTSFDKGDAHAERPLPNAVVDQFMSEHPEFNAYDVIEGTPNGMPKGVMVASRTAVIEQGVLYHVTYTRLVPKIQKEGILPMQTSNWVKGKNGDRYGGGRIFAFDAPEDAVRWAAKMDWEFNKGTGTGKISIIRFNRGNEKWEEDTADPISQASNKGHWWQLLGKVPVDQIASVTPLSLELVRALVAGKEIKTASEQPSPDTTNFKRWFNGSKVVDESGRPLRLYHGGGDHNQAKEFASEDRIYYFSTNPKYASMYAHGSTVYPVYLSLKNPFDARAHGLKELTSKEYADLIGVAEETLTARVIGSKFPQTRVEGPFWYCFRITAKFSRQALLKQGYDGIVQFESFNNQHTNELVYVAFRPNQIKSATGNRGTFDKSKDITAAANQTINFNDLPHDLQVLVGQFYEIHDQYKQFEQMQDQEFKVENWPLDWFPACNVATQDEDSFGDDRDAMSIPAGRWPVLVNGDEWLDGRHRVWAARQRGDTSVPVIDLGKYGLQLPIGCLGKIQKTAEDKAPEQAPSEGKVDGHWAGEGNAASGILAVCPSSGRVCLAWRSDKVQHGNCWASTGGAVKQGYSPEDSARLEMAEEVGYKGTIQLLPAYEFKDGSFTYFNFIGIVPIEFAFQPAATNQWETEKTEWFPLQEIIDGMKAKPSDYHPGIIQLFEHSGKLIKQALNVEEGDRRLASKQATWDWPQGKRCTQATLEAFGVRGKVPIHGTGILEALASAGFSCTPVDNVQGVNVEHFVRTHPRGSFYLSTINHAMALREGNLTDTAGRGPDKRVLKGAVEVKRGKQAATATSEAIRGWMAPDGKPHIFNGEHCWNLPPEFKRRPSMDPIEDAQRSGYVRFGRAPGSIHGPQTFVHYDATSPEGAATAIKALEYMKPEYNDMVSISGHRGLWSTTGQKAMADLETLIPASRAYALLRMQAEGALPPKGRAKSASGEFIKLAVSHKTLEHLEAYTHMNQPWNLTQQDMDQLHAEFPFEGGVLYRGINLRTKEAYDKFLAETDNATVYREKHFSGWTQSPATAKQFALTWPSYNDNMSAFGEVMRADHARQEKGDYMLGFKGLILQTEVPADTGIDVNATPKGRETEVILPAGEYPITIHKDYTPFAQTINSENYEQELFSVAKLGTEDDFDQKKFQFIMKNFNQFSDQARQHLAELMPLPARPQANVDVQVRGQWLGSKDHTHDIYIWDNVPGYCMVYFALFLPEQQERIKAFVNKALQQRILKVRQAFREKNIQDMRGIQFYHGTWELEQAFADPAYAEKYSGLFTKGLGKAYHNLDALVKEINQTKDRDQQQQAVRDYMKTVERLVKGIADAAYTNKTEVEPSKQ